MDSESRGALLVAGDDDRVVAPARVLAARLRVVASAPGLAPVHGEPFTAVGGRVVALAGRLGRFRAAAAAGQGDVVDLGPASPNADGFFDLVLDLGRTPLIASARPAGYFAACEPPLLGAALEALPRLVGMFHDPAPGTVRIGASCTVCGACANACPTQALQAAPRGTPKLLFLEAACVQCGHCAAACPEQAIALLPRAMQRGAAEPIVLAQAPHKRCIECGRPFAAQAPLQGGAARGLPPAARSALHRCPACRARALFAN